MQRGEYGFCYKLSTSHNAVSPHLKLKTYFKLLVQFSETKKCGLVECLKDDLNPRVIFVLTNFHFLLRKLLINSAMYIATKL